MHLVSSPEETAEAHNQRTPFLGIDMGTRAVATNKQRLFNVELFNVNFEQVGVHVFAKWVNGVDHAFHLHWTFLDPGRRNYF